MRRILVAAIAAFPLTVGVAAASADRGDQGAGGDGPVFGGDRASWDAPATTQVTITTDGNTRIRVNDQAGGVSDMTDGDHFVARFNGSPSDSLDTLVSNPAVAVFDRTPPQSQGRQVYAFVGNVTAVDTTAGTV